ncbi:hypothetical protein GN956_G7435 [Arapaima gigas]
MVIGRTNRKYSGDAVKKSAEQWLTKKRIQQLWGTEGAHSTPLDTKQRTYRLSVGYDVVSRGGQGSDSALWLLKSGSTDHLATHDTSSCRKPVENHGKLWTFDSAYTVSKVSIQHTVTGSPRPPADPLPGTPDQLTTALKYGKYGPKQSKEMKSCG